MFKNVEEVVKLCRLKRFLLIKSIVNRCTFLFDYKYSLSRFGWMLNSDQNYCLVCSSVVVYNIYSKVHTSNRTST